MNELINTIDRSVKQRVIVRVKTNCYHAAKIMLEQINKIRLIKEWDWCERWVNNTHRVIVVSGRLVGNKNFRFFICFPGEVVK